MLDTGVRVSCPAGGSSCSVSIPVSYLVKTTVAAKKKHGHPTVKQIAKALLSASLTVAPGQTAEAALALSPAALSVIAAAKHLKATARVAASATGAATQTLPVSITLTPLKPLKPPKKKHH